MAALAMLGILSVGASAYLVHLAVAFFDARLTGVLLESEDVVETVGPFHQALIDAEIAGFEARARALAFELALAYAAGDPGSSSMPLSNILAREPDLVAIERIDPDIGTIRFDREEEFPSSSFEWFEVTQTVPERGRPEGEGARLRVTFRIDPTIDERYQQLGAHKQRLGLERTMQADIETAVRRVFGIASGLVLVLSVLAGFALVRTTTRKANVLSRAMLRVGRGELKIRADVRGRDELGQLAEAFNRMLDELELAQEKVAYLQRIGAWQDMARRIAHEIKNPLTPIQLAVQQLREKDPHLSPEFTQLLRTSVEIVEDEIEGLRRMVVSFGRFAKMPEVRLEPVMLNRILDEFERAYGQLGEPEEHTLTIRRLAVDVEIEADRQLLKQALVNLVENAVLSAREHGVNPIRVDVIAAMDVDAVDLTVDDNGPGIAPERLETVFEPYETSRKDGTGLGLAIVKKVVLDHRGEVRASRGPLGGARFRIRLPRRVRNAG